MNVIAEITHIERIARENGPGVAAFIADAGIDRSTWTRWKAGKTLPRMQSWLAVEAATRRLYERGVELAK